jgi:hypothetical protein
MSLRKTRGNKSEGVKKSLKFPICSLIGKTGLYMWSALHRELHFDYSTLMLFLWPDRCNPKTSVHLAPVPE